MECKEFNLACNVYLLLIIAESMMKNVAIFSECRQYRIWGLQVSF